MCTYLLDGRTDGLGVVKLCVHSDEKRQKITIVPLSLSVCRSNSLKIWHETSAVESLFCPVSKFMRTDWMEYQQRKEKKSISRIFHLHKGLELFQSSDSIFTCTIVFSPHPLKWHLQVTETRLSLYYLVTPPGSSSKGRKKGFGSW